MEEKLTSFYEFTFEDGDKTEMTLAFYKLYKLRSKDKDLYAEYNEIMGKKKNDEFELVRLLYIAYVCAHLDEEQMDFEDFIIKLGSDRNAVGQATTNLLSPKKQ